MSVLPAGHEIEVLAVAMAAALGFKFAAVDAENRATLRVLASAALVRLGADNPGAAAAHLAGALDGAAKAIREAVAAADAAEGLISEKASAALYAHATAIERVGRVLGVLAEDAPEIAEAV